MNLVILRKSESLSLIPGDDEIDVVLAAVKSVADPKGFLSIKAITKLLLSEEKEERWTRLITSIVAVFFQGARRCVF